MKFSSTLALAAACGSTLAVPLVRRYDAAVTDAEILNYALTLEYLERKFYAEGIANYTQADFVAAGFPDPFYANLQEIYSDEKTHVDFLKTALEAAGVKPVQELGYAFGITDAKTFVTVSGVLEGVGTSAYLGAAASIVNKDYLTAAGAILTVEARHAAYIRSQLSQSPFPAPFDTPLDFNEVYSLAAAFITSVPADNPTLPFKAFPALSVASESRYVAGTTPVTFVNALKNAEALKVTPSTPVYAIFYSGLTRVAVEVCIAADGSSYYIAALPKDIAGQVYIVLSTSSDTTKVSSDNIVAGPAIIEVYP